MRCSNPQSMVLDAPNVKRTLPPVPHLPRTAVRSAFDQCISPTSRHSLGRYPCSRTQHRGRLASPSDPTLVAPAPAPSMARTVPLSAPDMIQHIQVAEIDIRARFEECMHADRSREQLADPCGNPAIKCRSLRVLPDWQTDSLNFICVLRCVSKANVLALASNGCLYLTDDTIQLLVRCTSPLPALSSSRNAALTASPCDFFVPPPVLQWVTHACHTNRSCHFGVTRTLKLIERYF